jgi:hypothetical protein
MAIFLKDDFTGTAGVSITSRSPTGTGATGSWTGSATAVQLNGSGGINFTNVNNNLIKATDNSNADHYAEGTAGAGFGSGSFPLAVRATDGNNFIGFRFSSPNYELYKRVSGSFTLLTSGSGSVSAGDLFKLSVSGNNFTVTKNGTTVLTATDSFNNTVTTCGIVCRSDNNNDVLRDFESGTLVTYTYARPTSDITTQWSTSSGSTHYTLIDETVADDNDYIVATAAGQTDEVKLASMTPPQVGTNLVINYKVTGVDGGATVTVSLRQGSGGTLIKTDTAKNANSTYQLTVAPGDWALVTDWSDLRLRFVSA